jgi:predicted extracellular nuclease
MTRFKRRPLVLCGFAVAAALALSNVDAITDSILQPGARFLDRLAGIPDDTDTGRSGETAAATPPGLASRGTRPGDAGAAIACGTARACIGETREGRLEPRHIGRDADRSARQAVAPVRHAPTRPTRRDPGPLRTAGAWYVAPTGRRHPDKGDRRSDDLAPTAVLGRVGIHAVQGSGRVSPLLGDDVTVEGLVTAVKSNGFFLQSAPGEEDAMRETSEGVFVFTSSAAPAAAAVGNRVSVSGRVAEYTPASHPHQMSVTQIASPSVTLVSVGNPLPAPEEIIWLQLSANSPVDELEKFEGMRVSAPVLAITGPDEGRLDESTATAEATGEFYVVLPYESRPRREPGIGVLDVTPLPVGVDPPDFDTNPERLRFDSTGQLGAPVITADGDGRVYGFVGVLDYGKAAYTLLPDPDAGLVAEDGIYHRDLPWALDEEVTIGTFNLQRFYDDVDNAGADTVLTTEAFQRRLARTARSVCSMMDSPDILGVVEVENLSTLSLLAAAINDNIIGGCRNSPGYVAHLIEGNDPAKINIGFLVSTREVAPGVPRVQTIEVAQLGKGEVFANPDGSGSLLNDRPSLMLRARIFRDANNSFPITAIANHLRSLNGINSLAPGGNGWSSEGHRVRAKRAAQARYLAGQVQARQAADPNENLLLLGDFNAFEFSDGYVDVMGIITGREAAASQVVNYVDSPITTPLTNLIEALFPEQRYSYIFEGNRQALDHIVASQALMDASPGIRMEYARFNAGAGGYRFGVPDRISRVSDHDPAVAYIPVSAFGVANVWAGIEGVDSSTAGKPAEWRVALFNNGPVDASDVVVDITLTAELPGLVLTPPAGFTCSAPAVVGGETVARCEAAHFPVDYSSGARIGLRTETLASQAGTEVMVIAEIRARNPDDYPDDNFTFSPTRLTPPLADLYLLQVNLPPGQVSGPTGVLEYRVLSQGRDEAVSPRFELELAGSKTMVRPTVPNGWTCTTTPVGDNSTRVVCDHAGDFLVPDEASFRFELLPGRSVQVSATARVSSVTEDPNPFNNTRWSTSRILVRTTQ